MNGEELLQLFIFHSYCMELQGQIEDGCQRSAAEENTKNYSKFNNLSLGNQDIANIAILLVGGDGKIL